MPYRLIAKPILESFIDNMLRDTVEPKVGSMVYCDLFFNTCEHSGIYIGNGNIVHLDGSGIIETVPAKKFLARLDGFNTAISIYVSSIGSNAVGDKNIAIRAKKHIGERRDYSLLTDNCHQFTAGCITSDFENNYNYFWQLKNQAKKYLECDTYRVWNREKYNLKETIESVKHENVTVCNTQQVKDTNQDLNVELVEFTSLLIHYIIDKNQILPIDIYYFENILKKSFKIDDKNILKKMYETKRKIKKEEIELLIESCYPLFTNNEQKQLKKLFEKIIIEDNKGVYEKYRDIKIAIYKIKKDNK